MTEEIASPEKPCARPSGHPPARVALVGFMGAGKSTVGRELGLKLGWRFLDLDDLIEERSGHAIAEIFKQDGEAGFRELEHAALTETLDRARDRLVLALGGGAFMDARNRELLSSGQVPAVFLDAPVEELLRRCRQMALVRPLLADQDHFRHLYEARRPRYLEALLSVETAGREVAAVVAEIIAALSLGVHLGVPK
jgi:shikimate kinase